MGCRQTKTKAPQRDEAKELEEKEKAEKAAQAKQEAKEAAAHEVEQPKFENQAESEEQPEEQAIVTEEKETVEDISPQQPVEELPVTEVYEPPAQQAPSYDGDASLGTMSAASPIVEQAARPDATAKITVASHGGVAMYSGRSVTPCDMTAVDQIAKYVSSQCGCDLGEVHDENNCQICRNMDLSDAPLLN
ncbi:GAP45 [Cardiosporidium cionae]|uniref:GAP45 n=1 Tax=Cardiosporidium cionae TaxID=476202 RepID=A0ABQ7JC78_9APIC|nr:GAP45 [Cardiosporidium cionae]|eukprot:KAF8821576.1 GAP45 [Cardiosporidium cionae]